MLRRPWGKRLLGQRRLRAELSRGERIQAVVIFQKKNSRVSYCKKKGACWQGDIRTRYHPVGWLMAGMAF